MGRKNRKRRGKPVISIRIEPSFEEYLARFTGKARAEAIREALGDWLDRQPDALEAKAKAMLRDADRLRDDARQLLNLAAEERKRRAEFSGELEAKKVRRQQAVLDALEVRRKAGLTTAPGWIDSPAGLRWCATLETDRDEALELAKRGVG